MKKLCNQAGYRFWRVVHEVQGGVSKSADAAMRAIAAAVAIREQRDPGAVRAELADRIAVVIARSSARAIRKRAAGVQRCARAPWSMTVARCSRDSPDDAEMMFSIRSF